MHARILGIALTGALALVAAGCGSDSGSSTDGGTSKNSAMTPSKTISVPIEAKGDGGFEGTLKLGQLQKMTRFELTPGKSVKATKYDVAIQKGTCDKPEQGQLITIQGVSSTVVTAIPLKIDDLTGDPHVVTVYAHKEASKPKGKKKATAPAGITGDPIACGEITN